MKRKQKAIGIVMGLWVICPTFSFAQSLIETVEIPSGTFTWEVRELEKILMKLLFIG